MGFKERLKSKYRKFSSYDSETEKEPTRTTLASVTRNIRRKSSHLQTSTNETKSLEITKEDAPWDETCRIHSQPARDLNEKKSIEVERELIPWDEMHTSETKMSMQSHTSIHRRGHEVQMKVEDERKYSHQSIPFWKTSEIEGIFNHSKKPHPLLSDTTGRNHWKGVGVGVDHDTSTPQTDLFDMSDSEEEDNEDNISAMTASPPTKSSNSRHFDWSNSKTACLRNDSADSAKTPSTISMTSSLRSSDSNYSTLSGDNNTPFLASIPCKFNPTPNRAHRRSYTLDNATTAFTGPPKSSRERFKSVLDRPLRFWKALDTVLESSHPYWSRHQRGRLIHHLIHFLEMKIGFDQYIPEGFLVPSPVIDQAWMALVLETKLYKQITRHIQDFHGKPRKSIHYSIRALQKGNQHERLERTQAIFKLYFRERMPMTIEEESMPEPNPKMHRSTFLQMKPIFPKSGSSNSLKGLAMLSINESFSPPSLLHLQARHQRSETSEF
jgi:hypothetical protein